MRICKIWDADYPWDIRVEKIVSSLTQAGHTVHLVCRNQARRNRLERSGNFVIHRLPSLPSLFGPTHTLWNFPFPVNPVWIGTIARVIWATRTDLILVRDILLALPAVFLAKLYRIPVVLDMAENYPAMLQDKIRYTPTGPLARCIRNSLVARMIENLCIRLVDHIIVVVEESHERMMRAGIPQDRLSIVCNTPRLDTWGSESRSHIPAQTHEGTNLVYLGNLDGSRGIDVGIRAVRRLKEMDRLVRLSIIGDGPNIQQFRDLAIQLNVSDRVTITGRLPFSEVQSIMSQSDIGLIPHYATEAWNSTIPNKLFDYMLLGMPVSVSEAKPTARIVREEGCGEVFRDRDDVDLARCISALHDPDRRSQAGRNGRSAVLSRYNWTYDSQVLLNTLEAVSRNRR